MTLAPVSQTAILTLRARAEEHGRLDRLFADPVAASWYAKVQWPVELNGWYTPWSQAKTAIRAQQIDELLRGRLAEVSGAVVVELGCGLSTRCQRIGPSAAERWFALDLPEVIELRKSFGAPEDGIACSVLDRSWFDTAGIPRGERLILIAEGLLYYLPRNDVDALFRDLQRAFAPATMIFDLIGGLDSPSSFAASARAFTPIKWTLDRSFERAMSGWGLEPLPGREPNQLMQATIAGFGARYGPAFAAVTRSLARVPWLRDRRSGLILGRFSPLH